MRRMNATVPVFLLPARLVFNPSLVPRSREEVPM